MSFQEQNRDSERTISSINGSPHEREKREKAIVKIIVLGCANVGKTSLMRRFATGTFTGERRPTIGADFLTKRLVIHDTDVVLQIWDTAGQERFHQGTLTSSFYRGAHGALLVYDVSNEKSMEQLAQWRDECFSRKDNEIYFPIVVVGNKTDLRDKMDPSDQVDQSVLLQWCRDNQYGHIEASAKDGSGVEAAMMAITALALESQRTSNNSKNRFASTEKVNLDTMYTPKVSGFCDGCSG